MTKARSLRSVPLPVKRGEGAEPAVAPKERRRGEAGEGHLRRWRRPLTRLVALPLATLSPPRGERERESAA
jgi:hypothetical protein